MGGYTKVGVKYDAHSFPCDAKARHQSPELWYLWRELKGVVGEVYKMYEGQSSGVHKNRAGEGVKNQYP
jgi:hypothetical protein